jgi:hypothetical protein
LSVFTVIDNSMTLTTYPRLALMLKVGRSVILPVLCASSGTGESLVAPNFFLLPNSDLSLSKTLYLSL